MWLKPTLAVNITVRGLTSEMQRVFGDAVPKLQHKVIKGQCFVTRKRTICQITSSEKRC